MRLKILSRASDLAVLQANMVSRALRTAWPDLDVSTETRSSLGDRELGAALWALPEKGLFTADLSEALRSGQADIVVHSWKDLPIAQAPGTVVAATLERADPRDVLIVRRDVVKIRPASIAILSSSPRRAFQLRASVAPLLPWPVASITTTDVRGNIPTRLAKLIAGDGDALVVAKAALDRLLSDEARSAARASVRDSLDQCHWMVLPTREFPTAAAQGALAIEIAATRDDLRERLSKINHQPTWDAVMRERDVLHAFGGGCHAAVGVTVLPRDYGTITSVRADATVGSGSETTRFELERAAPLTLRDANEQVSVWPRPDERAAIRRRALNVAMPPANPALWVARADALPDSWHVADDQYVWAAGQRTWVKLAARGIWVHGSADGLGDRELPGIDLLAGEAVAWRRLTHAGTGDSGAIGTYEVDQDLPSDLTSRTDFFWTSGSQFLRAIDAFPTIATKRHASGPGRTSRVIRERLGDAAHIEVWLDYEQWHHALTS